MARESSSNPGGGIALAVGIFIALTLAGRYIKDISWSWAAAGALVSALVLVFVLPRIGGEE